MCTDKVTSMLKSKSAQSLSSFSWTAIQAELKSHAPTLLSILVDMTKTCAKKDATAVICICASMILKFRNPCMSLVRHMLSVLLYAGHAKKKVIITIF